MAVNAVDQKIQTVVAIYRQQFHGRPWPANKPLPPAPPEMRTLQTDKDNIILSRVARLHLGFGAARFQRFDAYVQATFGPHITMSKPKIPARPTGNLPPFLPVPWK